ncbi:claudin-1-like isoform X3 [Dunckerocampus dactyliophorus]|uniref:claudin-1-like isoform X3 n=1 Tax=Dunckerocampus dactyliophorus TaxID=161453 RepID=UPI002405B815|nr:claudin-1-like isoform X3 [Dunckerocampus dactyliophorus]XP_054645129.1 claudin-1-like isoform X3 [Dunckerocampus dactyliophorus]
MSFLGQQEMKRADVMERIKTGCRAAHVFHSLRAPRGLPLIFFYFLCVVVFLDVMANSALQLIGFFLSLTGLAVTMMATVMVEWKRHFQGKSHSIYEGLWMSCSGEHRTTCELHESVLELPFEIQITRALLLLSIFLSAVALLVSTVGMKCTRFMDNKAIKSSVARIGGIIFMISGIMTFGVTSWFVKKIVHKVHESHHLHSFEFGRAVFVSWAAGLLTTAGGAFLTCGRCSRSSASSSISSNHLMPPSRAATTSSQKVQDHNQCQDY